MHAAPTLLYRLIARASRPVVERVYRLRVEGLEHVPAQGGFVVAANHTSNADPWPLGIALWPRSLHFMAKHEAWKAPLRWIIAGVGSSNGTSGATPHLGLPCLFSRPDPRLS